MSVTRKVFVSVLGVFFIGCLLVATLNLLAEQTLLNNKFVKQTLRDSGIYSSAADKIVTPELTRQLTSFEPTQTLITPAMIQVAAEKSFSPQFIQANTEKIVDVTEAWLNSTRADIQFEIPIKDQTAVFYSELEAQLTTKVKALPDCKKYSDGETALLQSQCLPIILSVNQAVTGVMDQVKTHSPYSDTLTEATMPAIGQQQGAAHLPDYIGYLWLANLLALGIGSLLLIILIWSGRWFGTIVVGVSAIIVAIAILVVVTRVPMLTQSLNGMISSDAAMQNLVRTATSSIARYSQVMALVIGGGGVIVSALGVLWWRLGKR